ncbi:hypothetical protein [Kitasatospora azatica]|uniref:hypothetical protein n=1 Tax=Kitasatospora azatica TaxID=58347 RepID=UPI000569F301|nr:hypothetical protein [Kitasatospora azatica]
MTDRAANPLDDYWRGEFTLQQEAPADGPSEPLPIELLAAPDITVGGRNLALLLAPVYRALTD